MWFAIFRKQNLRMPKTTRYLMPNIENRNWLWWGKRPSENI